MSAPGTASSRRGLLIAAVAGMAAMSAAGLAGCGFELRRAPQLPFQRIAFSGFRAQSPLAEALRQQLGTLSDVQLAAPGAPAQVVLDALIDQRERVLTASTAFGQTRVLTLRSRFKFRLRNAAGTELIGPTELVLSRDMSYSEDAALAKEQEEVLLYRAMEADIVSQVLRRLAAVKSA